MNTRRNQINLPFNFFSLREFREHLLLQFFSKRHTGIYTILDELRPENLDFFFFSNLFFDRNFIRDYLCIRCQGGFLLGCFFAVDSQPIDTSRRYRMILILKKLRVDQ